jgi:Mg2+ and Co2+ transporter CorA
LEFRLQPVFPPQGGTRRFCVLAEFAAMVNLGTETMIEKTIGEIEAKIRSTDAVNEERKRELLQLLGTLKSEVGTLAKTHDEQAKSIAGFAQVSAHEATRTKQNPQSLHHSLQGLRSSVDGFEKSNPKLVQIVNAISNILSNLGI